MSVITTFCLILSISDAFHTHNHHKHGKYHRSHIRQPQRQTIFTSGNQLSQIYAQLYQEAPNIDIRGSFADVSYQSSRERGHESLSVDQCGLRSEDFFETATRRNFVCTWKNEVIVRKHNRRQFWCIGYLPREKDKREKAVLTLKFDRSYQIGYSPGGIVVESSSKQPLAENFYLDTKKLNSIIIRGAYEGLPELEEIEFQGRRICDDAKNLELEDIQPVTQPPKPLTRDDVVRPHSPKTCGRRQMQHSQLISNGEESKSGDWPFHAIIFHTSIRTFQYKCGGTIISNSLILTAAHCVFENGNQIIPERVKVHLGRTNLRNFDRNSQEFSVFEILCHEDFNRDTVRHDIALLKLSTNMAFTTFIQPACLPMEDFSIVDKIGVVIGFGRTEDGQLSPFLKQARMEVPTTLDCLESNRDFYGLFLYEGNYCAGQLREKKAACAGDSGGGMYFKVKGVWIVRGIVSVGVRSDTEEECSPDNYVLYTDIYKHITWIKDKM